MGPADILAESFRIIESEVGSHGFGAQQWAVLRRMIHASGDLQLTASVRFERDVVAAGVRGLKRGTPIVTDVSMVAVGISKPLVERLGVRVHCFIDAPDVRRQALERGLTRSFCAMEKAIAEIGTAVYVVGNAPTALQALCEAVRSGIVQPTLVLALPVGFVAVAESKEEALALPCPVLTVTGRKGGSAIAAAAVNALLALAAEDAP